MLMLTNVKKHNLCRVVLALFFLVFGISVNAISAEKPDKINIGTFADPSTCKIGWEKGWFQEATGVETDWQTFDTGADVITSLASGDLDIASLGSTPTTTALARDIDLKVIAVEMDLAENEALIVDEDIDVMSDLEGQKIAVPFSSTCHYAMMRTLEMYNISTKDMDLLDMGSMEAAGAFKAGTIDGAWVWDPAYTEMLNAGGHILITSGMVGKMGYPTWNNIVVRADFAEEYPEVVTDYTKAFLRTIDYYHEDPADSASLVAKKLDTDVTSVKRFMERFGFIPAEQQLSQDWFGSKENPGKVVRSIQDMSKFLVDQKELDKPLSMDKCKDAIDRTYLKNAKD